MATMRFPAWALAWVLVAVSTVTAQEPREREALRAAEAWLALVDGGDYEKSWETAATLFRAATSRAQWSQALTAARAPLGRLVARTLRSSQFATTLPGAPDGEYVVIQYRTTFERKQSAVETITPMRDADGHWRVSGYYIR